MKRHVKISRDKAKNKPNTFRNKALPCPFCDVTTFKSNNRVLIERDTMLLIENKFPVFENAYQTVLVETDSCHEDLSNYPKETLHRILSFGLEQWLSMSQNDTYASVLFFKNHGEYSNASIAHPHMQIIGLKETNYQALIHPEQFDGHPIYQDDAVEWNLSTKPRNELYEFNIKIKKEDVLTSLKEDKTASFELFCLLIQQNIHFILERFCSKSRSFNLAFYEVDESIVVKIIPRRPDSVGFYSAVFLGYGISSVPSDLSDLANTIKKSYLPLRE